MNEQQNNADLEYQYFLFVSNSDESIVDHSLIKLLTFLKQFFLKLIEENIEYMPLVALIC